MHSPNRKVSVKEQQEWKIPPCISNWKNARVSTHIFSSCNQFFERSGFKVQVQLVYYTDKYKIKQNNEYNQFHRVPSPLGLLVSLNNNKYA